MRSDDERSGCDREARVPSARDLAICGLLVAALAPGLAAAGGCAARQGEPGDGSRALRPDERIASVWPLVIDHHDVSFVGRREFGRGGEERPRVSGGRAGALLGGSPAFAPRSRLSRGARGAPRVRLRAQARSHGVHNAVARRSRARRRARSGPGPRRGPGRTAAVARRVGLGIGNAGVATRGEGRGTDRLARSRGTHPQERGRPGAARVRRVARCRSRRRSPVARRSRGRTRRGRRRARRRSRAPPGREDRARRAAAHLLKRFAEPSGHALQGPLHSRAAGRRADPDGSSEPVPAPRSHRLEDEDAY